MAEVPHCGKAVGQSGKIMPAQTANRLRLFANPVWPPADQLLSDKFRPRTVHRLPPTTAGFPRTPRGCRVGNMPPAAAFLHQIQSENQESAMNRPVPEGHITSSRPKGINP